MIRDLSYPINLSIIPSPMNNYPKKENKKKEPKKSNQTLFNQRLVHFEQRFDELKDFVATENSLPRVGSSDYEIWVTHTFSFFVLNE